MAAKYPIPAPLLDQLARWDGVVLHRGVYVDVSIEGTEGPDDAFCALCDGGREITCHHCQGQGALIATAQVWDPDDQQYYETDVEKPCPGGCKGGCLRCPQSRARWCHE